MSDNGCIEWYAIIAAAPVLIRGIFLSIFNVLDRYVSWDLFNLGPFRPQAPLSAHLCRLAALFRGNSVLPSFIITANAIALALHVKNLGEVASRSGMVATINLALLLAGSQFDIVASIQGDSLRSQLLIHRCLSSATLVTATLHVLAVVVNGRMMPVSAGIWGLTVSTRPVTGI